MESQQTARLPRPWFDVGCNMTDTRRSPRLGDELLGDDFLENRLSALAAAVLRATEGADLAGVTVLEHGHIRPIASTEGAARQAAELQYRWQEGPLHETAGVGHVVEATDLAQDTRWPRFGPAAADLGIHALSAHRVVDEPRFRADLNLYSVRRGRILSDRTLLTVSTDHAALLLEHARTVSNLALALESRTVIGQAMGLVMCRYGLTPNQAFAFLRRESQTTNTKLRVICADLVAQPREASSQAFTL